MKRFKSKGDQRLGQLIVKFGQLTMAAVETISEFLDLIRNCIAEIRACDPSQVPTEETAIRAKAGIGFAFPHLYAALKLAQKMSLENLLELMDAFIGKIELFDEKKKVEAVSRLVEMIILKKNIQMEKLSITETKTGQTKLLPGTNT